MTRVLLAVWAAAGFATAACHLASPTAPSGFGVPTDPVAISSSTPLPAPLTQTLTGTWYRDGQNFMTVTQDGPTASGMTVPVTLESGRGFTSAWRGVITGTVIGDHVVLHITTTIRITGPANAMTCRSADTFIGTLAGSQLSGAYNAGTSAFDCGGTQPPVDLSPLNGAVTFTRQ